MFTVVHFIRTFYQETNKLSLDYRNELRREHVPLFLLHLSSCTLLNKIVYVIRTVRYRRTGQLKRRNHKMTGES